MIIYSVNAVRKSPRSIKINALSRASKQCAERQKSKKVISAVERKNQHTINNDWMLMRILMR